MTPPMASQEKKPIKKRYPAPPCTKCKSGYTTVMRTGPIFRRCECQQCGNRWWSRNPASGTLEGNGN